MNLLFLSNFYPPARNGGYEQLCQETAEELIGRGHRVTVLTTRSPGLPKSSIQCGVSVNRYLHVEVRGGLADTIVSSVGPRQTRDNASLDALRRTVDDLQPDRAMIWGMWNVPRVIPALAENLLTGRLAYYLCDYWPSLPSALVQQLTGPSSRFATRLPKLLVGRASLAIAGVPEPPSLRLDTVACVSRAVRDILTRTGLPMQQAQVIPNGIKLDDFQPLRLGRPPRQGDPLRLLYAGRLTPEKGVHTAIRALSLVRQQTGRAVRLDVVGQGDRDYTAKLHDLIRRNNLADVVSLCPIIPRAEMPRLLAEYDSLLFPSEWEEPFSRVVMEAMAVGLVVIGTPTGGTGELLVEGKTGLTYPPGDASALAAQIERLRDDPTRGRDLAEAARQTVAECYTFHRMVDSLSAQFASLVMN